MEWQAKVAGAELKGNSGSQQGQSESTLEERLMQRKAQRSASAPGGPEKPESFSHGIAYQTI